MKVQVNKIEHDLAISKVLLLIFIPTTLVTVLYALLGEYFEGYIPSLLLFFLLAVTVLFPAELYIVLHASKKEYGDYSFKSALNNQQRLPWWTIFIYGTMLWGWAGLMSVLLLPLEELYLSPITEPIKQLVPTYYDWMNLEYLKQYPKGILILTCVIYWIFNGFIGPVIEELFFRGYLTAKVDRYSKYAPVIITVLFSVYHFWLPFSNIFRVAVFLPVAYIAWKKKNVYIAIVFHCLCNMVSVISFTFAVWRL